MLSCPRCHRDVPEVRGAPSQRCPHCGLEILPTAEGTSPAASAAAPADAAGAASLAFRTYARLLPKLLLLWAPLVLAEMAAGAAFLAYALSQGIDPTGALTPHEALRVLGVAVPLYGVVAVGEFALWILVARLVLQQEGRPVAPLVPVKVVALGATLVVTYLAGLALLIVPFFIFFHWFLYAPAMMAAQPGGVGEAFDRSRQFSRTRRTGGFTALVVLVAIGAIFLSVILDTTLIRIAALLGATSPYVTTITGPLAGWLVGPLVATFPAAYVALSGAPAPAAPASVPGDRFRTTKCPQCATLIPYQAGVSGAPVDVTCPVCGRSGRVL